MELGVKATVESVAEQLIHYQSPFSWEQRRGMLGEIVPANIIEKLENKLDEKKKYDIGYLMLYVGLSFEYTMDKRPEEALQMIEAAENMLNNFAPEKFESTKMLGFLHIMYATKAHLLLEAGRIDESARVIQKAPRIESMDNHNKATIYGLQGLYFGRYGRVGWDFATRMLSTALKLDDGEAWWYYLSGKYLGYLRRSGNFKDRTYEQHHLEMAYKIKKDPAYVTLLADLYRVKARRMNHYWLDIDASIPIDVQEKMSELNRRAEYLFSMAFKLEFEDPITMFRCARGLMLLPRPHKKLEMAKDLLERGLKLSPQSGFGNHQMAKFYELYERNITKAMEHLQTSTMKNMIGAEMDLLRLRLRYKPCKEEPIDVVKTLEDMLARFPDVEHKCLILAELVTYSIFVKDDLDKACNYARAILESQPYSKVMRRHRQVSCTNLTLYRPINLYELLVDEIKIELKKLHSRGDKSCYTDFLDLLSDNKISYPRTGKPQNLKTEYTNAEYDRILASSPHVTPEKGVESKAKAQSTLQVPQINWRTGRAYSPSAERKGYSPTNVRVTVTPPKDDPPSLWGETSQEPTSAEEAHLKKDDPMTESKQEAMIVEETDTAATSSASAVPSQGPTSSKEVHAKKDDPMTESKQEAMIVEETEKAGTSSAGADIAKSMQLQPIHSEPGPSGVSRHTLSGIVAEKKKIFESPVKRRRESHDESKSGARK